MIFIGLLIIVVYYLAVRFGFGYSAFISKMLSIFAHLLWLLASNG